MFRPNLSRWLGKLFAPPSDRSRLRAVLGVTPLEDRTVPAAIPVTGPSGGTWVKVDTLTVSTRTNQNVSTGVTSNVVLDAGVTYLAVASGTARIATDATGFADAEFIRYNKSTGPQDGSSPGYAWNNHGVRVAGVSGGDTGGNFWGGYQADHVYPVLVAGQGTTVTGYYSDIPGYYGDNSGTLTVDLYAEVPLVSVTATDTGDGSAAGGFTFTRTGDLSGPLTVTYSVGGTATPGSDYTPLTGTVTFAAGLPNATVPVAVTDDISVDAAETVSVTLVGDAGYLVGTPDVASLTLIDRGTIQGFVWFDDDSDGVRTAPEQAAGGQPVSLWTMDGEYVQETETQADGTYRFTNLPHDLYKVVFDAPPGYTVTTPGQSPEEAEASDADPFLWSSSDVLPHGANSTTLINAGMAPTLAPPAPPDGKTTIVITDRNTAPATSLHVAKLYDNMDGQGRFIGPNKNNHDFIDRDPDHFKIWVYDKNAWMGKGPTIDVTLETKDNPVGFAEYNDPSTTIRLVRSTSPGWFVSDSLILVSNRADDEYADSRIGADESAPGGRDGTADGGKGIPLTDRTHRVALGGTVLVKYNGLEKTAAVPALAVVTVNGIILCNGENTDDLSPSRPVISEAFNDTNGDGFRQDNETYRDTDGDGKYTVNLSGASALARFKEEIKVANECYAQAGIKIVIGAARLRYRWPAIETDPMDLLKVTPVRALGDFTKSEWIMLSSEYNSPRRDDIEVYYNARGQFGVQPRLAFGGSAFSATLYQFGDIVDAFYDSQDSIVMFNSAQYYTLAHEMGHLLNGGLIGHSGNPIDLLRSGTTKIVREQDTAIGDSRRLSVEAQKLYLKSEYAKSP